MLVSIKRNSSKDNAFIVRSKAVREGFGLNKTDFDLGREYAMTFNVNKKDLTLKGRCLRSRGDDIRIGVKNIPGPIHAAFLTLNGLSLDLQDVRKIEKAK